MLPQEWSINAPTFCDSHAHLNDEKFTEDLEGVLERAEKAGIARIVNVGCDEKSSVAALEQATKSPLLSATCGLHPHDASQFSSRTIDFLDSLAADPKIVALGETGLDKYYNHSPFEMQLEAFSAHLELAERVRLPVVIHCREAYPELVKVLNKHNIQGHAAWQVHCFSGDAQDLAALAALDCYFSVGGSVTFRNYQGQELIRAIPENRLLLETDAPYLAPTPHRGKRNEPALLPHAAESVAAMRGITLAELSKITNENFSRIFGLEITAQA